MAGSKLLIHPSKARMVIERGKLAVVIGLEIDFDHCFGGRCSAQELEDMIDSYYDMGIRHMFITHLNDNDVGGTAMYGSRVRSIYQRVYRKNIFEVHDCSEQGYWDPNSSKRRKTVCNSKGLTAEGAELVSHMMKRNILIDVDHLSEKSLDKVLDITESANYLS